MNKLLEKYLYSKDNDMTEFNRMKKKTEEAKKSGKFKEMIEEINDLNASGNKEAAKRIESSPEYKDMEFYDDFLRNIKLWERILKGDLKNSSESTNEDVNDAKKDMEGLLNVFRIDTP